MLSRRELLLASTLQLSSVSIGSTRSRPQRQRRRAGAAIDWAREIAGKALYSESVYLDLVSEDGDLGFIARIGLYPTLERSWLWAHAFDSTGLISFTTESGSASGSRTDLEASRADYRSRGEGSRFHLFRRGPRSAPIELGAKLSYRGHKSSRKSTSGRGAQPPHGRGKARVEIEALLRPGHLPASNLSGRTEVLGEGSATMTLAGRTHRLHARGHFHEQTQDRARFVNPFVYATLRGEKFYSVAIKTERGAVGFAWLDEELFEISSFAIDAPTPIASESRGLRLDTAGESGVAGVPIAATLSERHLYSVPIYDARRRGTLVSGRLLGEHARPISGCINDHLPQRIDYARD